MTYLSPSHAWATWLDRPSDLALAAANAATVRAALDALTAGQLPAARRLWTSVDGPSLLAAWNAANDAMADTSRWPSRLRESTSPTGPRTVKALDQSISRRVFERDRYRCGYCGIPVVTQWQGGDIPRLVEAFPDVTPHLTFERGSIFVYHSPTNESCSKWLWITAVADHITPAAHGGPTEMHNLITACSNCNYSKQAWTLDELDVLPPQAPTS